MGAAFASGGAKNGFYMFDLLNESFSTLYKYRELILSLVNKELKSRYRGSALGLMWTLLNPLLLMLVYALVFSVYMRIDLENYSVFVFCGLLPWIWFSTSLTEGVNAITSSGSLITKSMFPAEVLPVVKILSNLFNYVFSLPLLLVFMLWFGLDFSAAILWLPVLMLAQLLFITGLVYFLSSLNVRFRDVQHILNNFLVLWFFLCPIIYPVTSVPEHWRFTFYLNPMAILAIGYQNIFFYAKSPEVVPLLGVAVIGLALTLIGFWQFERDKERFAEDV